MHLTNVLLPAPFSPNSAWTSPGKTSNEIESLARTPGKCLVNPRTRSRGPSPVGGTPLETAFISTPMADLPIRVEVGDLCDNSSNRPWVDGISKLTTLGVWFCVKSTIRLGRSGYGARAESGRGWSPSLEQLGSVSRLRSPLANQLDPYRIGAVPRGPGWAHPERYSHGTVMPVDLRILDLPGGSCAHVSETGH